MATLLALQLAVPSEAYHLAPNPPPITLFLPAQMASNKPTGAFSPTATPKYVSASTCRFRKIDFLPFTQSYRYLNDFSKALASEVRILLQEVGKLRDERRALQQ